MLICQSEACHKRLKGGGARAVAYGVTFIYVSPRGADTTILAHEFSHIALHARIGLLAFLRGDVPAWFDEGLAVLVSQDRRYLDEAGVARNCDAVRVADLPVSRKDWRDRAGSGDFRTLYHDAACAAQAHLAMVGGLEAALAAGF